MLRKFFVRSLRSSIIILLLPILVAANSPIYTESELREDFVGVKKVEETLKSGETVVRDVLLVKNKHTGKIEVIKTQSVIDVEFQRGEPETTVVWVDRNHLNAIADYSRISGEGMHIFTNWQLNNGRVSLYLSHGGTTPLWSFDADDEFRRQVGASQDACVLSAGENTILSNWERQTSTPKWTRDVGENIIAVDVSHDGSTIVYTTYSGSDGIGWVYAVSASTGAPLWDYEFADVGQLALSEDGSVVAVLTYDSCYVFDASGQRGVALLVNGSQNPEQVALSDDGNLLVFGDYQENLWFYEWKGVDYELKWSAEFDISGYYDWVIAVDIAGRTIFAGTQGFDDYKNYVAKFDTSSNVPVWECHRYGYGMSSVALSADGNMGIVGCVGNPDLPDSTRDAISVFDMSDSIPILTVSDNPLSGGERGSILSVDLSDSGEWAVTSGKAVRSYEFGNGGEVYSIHIGDRISTDVGPTAINSPTTKMLRDSLYTVETIYKNFGEDTVSFDVYFTIHDSLGALIYSDDSSIVDLYPQWSKQITFANWNCPEYGWYKFTTYTTLTGDEYSGNDTISLTGWAKHDAAVTYIHNPFDEITVNQSTPVVVKIENIGTYDDTISVIATILDSNEVLVYADTLDTLLLSDEYIWGYFNDWTPDSVGEYTILAEASVIDDYDTLDNRHLDTSASVYEIMYDDGSLNSWYYVSSEYHDNKFAVRFTPVIDTPMVLKRVRVMVRTDDPFLISVNQDSLGLPGAAILGPDSVSCISPPDWAEKSYYYMPTTQDDFWVVFHWLSTSPSSPRVGADNNYPCEQRSWWHYTGKKLCPIGDECEARENQLLMNKALKFESRAGWTNVDYADWMIRALVTPPGEDPDISVLPESLYFDIHNGGKTLCEKNTQSPIGERNVIQKGNVELSVSPTLYMNNPLVSSHQSPLKFNRNEPETLYYDDGSIETGIGLSTSGSPFDPGPSQTYGFATKFSHFPTNIIGAMSYFSEFNGSSFRLYVWEDNAGVPASGETPVFVDMNVPAPAAGSWYYYSLDTLPVPNPFWVGVIYNHIGSSPDWRIGYDQNTSDDHTYGNLSGGSGDWASMSSHNYGYAYGIRAVVSGVGIVSDSATMWVYNHGSGDLSVSDMTWDSTWIKSVNPQSFLLSPSDSQMVTVTVESDGLPDGTYRDIIRINSNDPGEPNYPEPVILDIALSGIEESQNQPPEFSLSIDGLNKIGRRFSISFGIPLRMPIKLSVYDLTGRLVTRLADGVFNPGFHRISWEPMLTSGVYFIHLKGKGEQMRDKIIILR
ncbi:hypothetical protein KAW18_07640 [candidate division WOR-3 bacterium]|nr:hypothetical protein [candidate division WOR-3 bacterium]